MLLLRILAIAFAAGAFMAFGLVLLHALRRSRGTALMVAGIPFYFVVYAISQFDHPRRPWVLAVLFGCLWPAVVLTVYSR